jgi:hypothetical protein
MPAPKDYIKISYPRKCEHCDYLSNNPQMYSYHKHTHDPIPEGQLCDHGCGQLAIYRGTGGKYTCNLVAHHCPAYLQEHSSRIKQHWEGNISRKEATRKSFIERLHNKETVEKQSKTKREKFGTLDPVRAKEYRHYARFIRQRAQRWAKSQGYVLGQQTYHVDHKLSILDAWHAGLTEEVVNHPANLQILEAKLNSGKGAKSILTVNELLAEIKRLS